MSEERISGSCLCGKVAYEVTLPFMRFLHCHCSRCRKMTGSVFAANAIVEPDAFRWTRGEELVARYDLPTAKSFASSFCTECGSTMPHATRSGEAVIVPSGTFDEAPDEQPVANIHWDSRAPWCVDPGSLPNQS